MGLHTMAIRRSLPMPVPPEELSKIQSYLSPQYGAQVWEDGHHRVLLVRVPHDAPDMVNDVEHAVEYLAPADTQDLTHCILIGDKRLHAVPHGPLQELMARRVEFDNTQCALLRQTLAEGDWHLYRAPDDPHRAWRLGIHLERATVSAVEDDDLEALTDELGPHLEEPRFADVRAVYLVARKDHVRLDPDLFLQDLQDRFHDDEREREQELAACHAAERARRQAEAAEREKEREHRRIVRDIERRFGSKTRTTRHEAPGRVAVGRMRSMEESRLPDQSAPERRGLPDRPDAPERREMPGKAAGLAGGGLSDRPMAPVRPDLPPADAPAEEQLLHTATEVEADVELLQARMDRIDHEGSRPPTQRERTPPERLHRRLVDAGYDVLEAPETGEHVVDLAAERARGYPQRVIARFPDRLTHAIADELLQTARALEVDMSLCVCEAADPEAKRKLVATKVKWLTPKELHDFSL